MVSNHMPCKVCDEITYPFLNFSHYTDEVNAWPNSYIPQYYVDIITNAVSISIGKACDVNNLDLLFIQAKNTRDIWYSIDSKPPNIRISDFKIFSGISKYI